MTAHGDGDRPRPSHDEVDCAWDELREQGWYRNAGEESGVTDDWHTVSALVDAGH